MYFLPFTLVAATIFAVSSAPVAAFFGNGVDCKFHTFPYIEVSMLTFILPCLLLTTATAPPVKLVPLAVLAATAANSVYSFSPSRSLGKKPLSLSRKSPLFVDPTDSEQPISEEDGEKAYFHEDSVGYKPDKKAESEIGELGKKVSDTRRMKDLFKTMEEEEWEADFEELYGKPLELYDDTETFEKESRLIEERRDADADIWFDRMDMLLRDSINAKLRTSISELWLKFPVVDLKELVLIPFLI
jgi:hypothetical protein